MNFLDTNVIIYAHTDLNIAKQQIAQSLINQQDTIVSTQVCTEFVNALHRKFKVDWPTVHGLLGNLLSNLPVHINTTTTVLEAIRLVQVHQFSWYDSLIVASALETGATKLYSEDLHHGLLIDKRLTIINPFI
jgi:predicted nucleic acid-binding protein